MKKITQVAETGGARIDFDDLRETFNKEIWDAMQGMMSLYDSDVQGIIVSGCTIGGSGPSSYTISAGIVYIDGEFRRLAATTGLSLPQYIKAATDVNTTRTFEDTTIKTLFITEGADLAGSAPGAGQYIAITTTTDPDDRRLWRAPIFPSTCEALGGFRTEGTGFYEKTKYIDIGAWNMDSTAFLAVAHGISDHNTILSVIVTIYNDAANTSYNLTGLSEGSGAMSGFISGWDATNITLGRLTSGNFDNSNFDSAFINRGVITVKYAG
jgi:hypothetical protein